MKKHSKKFRFFSIRRKLLFLIVITSACITTALTAVTYYIDYRNEVKNQNINLSQIESTTVKSLNKALWHVDDELVATLINGLLEVQDIVHVEARDQRGQLIHLAEKKSDKDEKEKVNQYLRIINYSLIHATSGGEERLGTLSVHITNYYLYTRLLKRIVIFFIVEGLKVLVISLIMFFIFNFYVTRHLHQISRHFLPKDNQGDREFSPFQLKRESKKKEDELDIVVNTFNEMVEVINRNSIQLKKEIEDRNEFLSQTTHLIGLGELAGSVGHQINGPLMMIHGYVKKIQNYSVTREDPQDREVLIDASNKVLGAVDRITNVAKSLRHLAHLNTREEIKSQEIGLLMEDVRALAEEKLSGSDISFRVEFYHLDASFSFPYRRTQVAQILINLFNNAYFEVSNLENSWIHFQVTKDDKFLYLSVVDSGKGIPSEFKDKIFDPFFTTRPSGARRGVGLNLAKNIMSQHNGEIYFDESSPHTKITLKFPLVVN